jgi:tRNA nucleotidyltransferase (CCA-adding enzyme)
LLPADGRPDLLLLAALLDGIALGEARELLDRFEFPAAERDRTLAALAALPALVRGLPRSLPASGLHSLAAAAPIEAVALGGAVGGRSDANARNSAERWLAQLRHVRLEINGDDLLAAGVPEGPEVGRRLQAALRKRLDGELDEGKVAELHAALEGS